MKCVAAVALTACANSEPAGNDPGSGGSSTGAAGASGGSSGGTGPGPGVAGTTGASGSIGSGSAGASGNGGSAGATGVAGSVGTGSAGTTGTAGQGGATGAAGTTGNGGRGGTTGTGGGGTTGAAGTTGNGGRGGTTGAAGTSGGRGGTTGSAGTSGGRGGSTGTGGCGSTGSAGTTGTGGTGGAVTIDCNAAMPTGGTTRSSNNASGTAAGMAWTIWTNSGPGTITYFPNNAAFAASWNGSGDFLARLGLQWNNTKTYDQYGTITAQYASRKTGSAGGYSYIGMYGWSTNPCVEFYIVDDSYNRMPVNPGNTTNKGTVTIDGAPYIMYLRNTTGTGGSKCGSSVNNWAQYYSVRMTARTCGQISVTEHFKAWAGLGMQLGKMDQAQILIEAGGGTGSIEFPVAQVTATMP